jgi:hypothetical protein
MPKRKPAVKVRAVDFIVYNSSNMKRGHDHERLPHGVHQRKDGTAG